MSVFYLNKSCFEKSLLELFTCLCLFCIFRSTDLEYEELSVFGAFYDVLLIMF
jgi:hypothetical protein